MPKTVIINLSITKLINSHNYFRFRKLLKTFWDLASEVNFRKVYRCQPWTGGYVVRNRSVKLIRTQIKMLQWTTIPEREFEARSRYSSELQFSNSNGILLPKWFTANLILRMKGELVHIPPYWFRQITS